MTPTLTPVDLGFSVADGEDLVVTLQRQCLTVTFVDWQETKVAFVCPDAIAVRWQEAEYVISPSERNDSVYEVLDSFWLKQHQQQGCVPEAVAFHHYKMNFNAAGVLEVICSKVEKTEPFCCSETGDNGSKRTNDPGSPVR
jgi:hypothetical protein